MELDKRIKEGKKPLTCFDVKEAKQFIGKECYLSNSIADYADLNNVTAKRILDYVSNTGIPYSSNPAGIYCYCLPCEWVEEEKNEPEKKYRAFTLAEWIDRHEIGDIIRYRCKSQKIELCHMYVGYAYGIGTDIKNTTSGTLTLGVASYTLDYLFEDYEICIYGEWQPFGVLDE